MVDCVISDVSEGGARLEFSRPMLLPRQLVLVAVGERSRRARLVWRRGSQMGVAFG